WTQDFLDQLDAAGLAWPSVPGLGYRLPDGAAQLDPLGWANADQLLVVFSEDVAVEAADLALSGLNVASYGFDNFLYNPAARTATWTLDEPLEDDRLLLWLDAGVGGVADAAGNRLDGEWTTAASSFPSGDGQAGGNFGFRFTALPADADADGRVDFGDVQTTRVAFGTASGAMPSGGDFDGDGGVDFGDFQNVRVRFGRSLPPLPAAPGALAILAPSGTVTDTRTPEITWQASAAADTYDLTIATDAACTTPVQSYPDLTTTSLVLPAALANNTYYVCVTAKNSGGTTVA
ncbi:MAG: hypothetical protein GY856_40520, partial [bacterium]|nr:hypothetical protein [bacterium]